MNTAETRSDRKRRAILSAATIVFLREGFASTTMDQVAALAEASKLTIYGTSPRSRPCSPKLW